MDSDLILAIAHHLAVFALVAVYAAEFACSDPAFPAHRSANWAGSTLPMAAWPPWSSSWASFA